MTVVNGQFTRTNSFGAGAERNYPRFFIESVQDAAASVQAGRPIFRDEERVEIIMPGNPYTRPVQRVSDEHREKWAKQYAAFKAGLTFSADGTPLEEWPRLRRSQVMELKALGFVTVEQVAKMDDHAIQRVGMGGRQLCDLAKAFLDDAARAATVERLADENTRKEAEVEELRRQVAELSKVVNAAPVEMQTPRSAQPQVTAAIPGANDGASAGAAALGEPAPASSLDAIAQVRVRERSPEAE
jgi:hypothetical protein